MSINPTKVELYELTQELRKEYLDNWSNCSIKPNYQRDLDQAVSEIEKHQSRYKSVSEKTSVPWYVIAIIHGLEASYKFNSHLRNGDPLTARTIHEPVGRPQHGNPPFSWEESAIDSLKGKLKNIEGKLSWDLPTIFWFFERYNGWGYRMGKGRKTTPPNRSAYIYSGTFHYDKGKYVADSSFDEEAISKQVGCMAQLFGLVQKGLVSIPHTGEHNGQVNDINPPVLTRILRTGSKGQDVETLQKLLNEKGFDAGQVDGDFGPKTEAAVKKFQTQASITVDGIVGPQTWQALSGQFTESDKVILLGGFISLKDISNKKIDGFLFPYSDPFAKPAISSNPKRWIGEPGQRARYLQDDDMPVVENPQVRSPEQIRQVIDYLNVADPQNKRYWPQGRETYCNIFARDVMRCLRAPLTHWVGEKEQEANDMHDWLSTPANGWKKVSVDIATSSAAKGIPTLVCWKHPRGIGHIAVVRPEPGQPNNPRIAQAGSSNFANDLMTAGFKSRTVSYFIYKD